MLLQFKKKIAGRESATTASSSTKGDRVTSTTAFLLTLLLSQQIQLVVGHFEQLCIGTRDPTKGPADLCTDDMIYVYMSNNHDPVELAGSCWEAENQGRVDVDGLDTPFQRRPSVDNILGPATKGMYVVDSCPANSDFSIPNGVLAQSGGTAYKNGICKASQNTRPDHCTGQKSEWYRYGPILFSASEKLTPQTFQAKYYGGKCTPNPGTLDVAPGSTISFTTKLCSCVTPGEGLYNNKCWACPVGKAAATSSSPCKSCTAGQYQEQGPALSYGCKTCSAGQYSVHKEQPCTNCPTGQSQTLSVATAWTCNECAKGRYASSATVACTNCVVGQYQEQTVATTHACKTCGLGQYSPNRETNGCSNCVAGQYQESAQATEHSCKVCTTGRYESSSSSGECTGCPIGKNLMDTGATTDTQCTDCVVGLYNPFVGHPSACLTCPSATEAGQSYCAGCIPGKRLINVDGDCEDCTVGLFTDERDLATCKECPRGYYTNDVASPNGDVRLNRCQGCPRGKLGEEGANKGLIAGCVDCAAGKYNEIEGNLLECKNCPAGTFATATGNTKDSDCINCGTGKWSETVAASEANECQDCISGKYNAGVGASDETACTFCDVGSEQDQNGMAYCLPCTPGSYGATDAMGFAVCLSCQPGTYTASISKTACDVCPTGRNSDVGSVSCSLCPAGYKHNNTKLLNGTIVHVGDGTCASCPPGLYQEGIEKESCNACPQGKVSTEAGSSSCSVCDNGEYQDNIGQSSCDICLPGSYKKQQVFEGNANEIYKCKSCTPGQYQNIQGATSCLNCPPGRHSADVGVTACQKCLAGTFIKSSGSDATSCTSCPSGFSNNVNESTNCVPNPQGSYMVPAVQGGMNFVLCPKGHYCSGGNWTKTPCQPGYAAENRGSVVCLKCTPGQYSTMTGSEKCKSCPVGHSCAGGTSNKKMCPPGSAAENEGSVVCLKCTPGQYSSNYSSDDCFSCPPMTYASSENQTSCETCEIGKKTENGQTGATSCQSCGAGEYGVVCDSCAVGMYRSGSDPDATVCKNCPNGYHQDSPAGAACLKCIPGTHQPLSGKKLCNNCPINEYSPTSNSSSCFKCSVGKTSAAGSSQCQSCEAGTYGKICSLCELGMYRPGGNDISAEVCLSCPAGFFQNVKGSASCLPCTPGTYQTQSNTSACDACSNGRASNNASRTTVCDACTIGRYQSKEGMTSCLTCIPGRYQSMTESLDCIDCDMGTMTYKTESASCETCALGKFTPRNASASCVSCSAGRYGLGCVDCPVGYFRDVDDTILTRCVKCEEGEETTQVGSASCSSCDLGRFGNSSRQCSNCPVGQYQDKRKSIDCKFCQNGEIPNKLQTSCQRPLWKTPKDCSPYTQYLNDSDTDKFKWDCKSCPNGGFCGVWYTIDQVRARYGYWRIPWSESNMSFVRCPYPSDCLGVLGNGDPVEEDEELENQKDVTEEKKDLVERYTDNSTRLLVDSGRRVLRAADAAENVTRPREGCKYGTRGPLCSLCIKGFNRDVNECVRCTPNAVPMRIGIFATLVCFAIVLAILMSRWLKKRMSRYSVLWATLLQILAINVTYSQINSSLPSVIDIEWPEEWKALVRKFAFVNIDIMNLIGVKCVGDFTFYQSFTMQVCLPVTILVLSFVYYECQRAGLAVKIKTMSKSNIAALHREALHRLFELADADQSGEVGPSELAGIIRVLGWKITLEEAIQLSKNIGASVDEEGCLILSEQQFVDAMISHRGGDALKALNVPRAFEVATEILTKKSTQDRAIAKMRKNKRGTALQMKEHHYAESDSQLDNEDALVAWTLRASLISSSLSGATQLLLLAHTPVSRKAFEYFNCDDLAGRRLMKADYSINCNDEYYQWFMPFVFVVLACFTAALPLVISSYLIKHRKDLYTSLTHSKIGWLYAPFNRGAEFWNVHDVTAKMFLTGVLIYVPPASRAGVAILICFIIIGNLNYFKPNKQKPLFWLSYLSFYVSGSKYVMALLLSLLNGSSDSRSAKAVELRTIGFVLIGLDLTFMICSFLCLLGSICCICASKDPKLSKKKTVVEMTQVTPVETVVTEFTPILSETEVDMDADWGTDHSFEDGSPLFKQDHVVPLEPKKHHHHHHHHQQPELEEVTNYPVKKSRPKLEKKPTYTDTEEWL